MNRFVRFSLSVCVLAFSAQPASAQEPPTAAPQSQQLGQPRGPRPKPTNLKVLPKDMTGDEVVKLMRQYEGDLGVECGYCHARNPETKRNDLPSDANPVKEKARIMIRMTDDLNAKYLTQLADHKSTNVITCGTCHRGMSHPEPFVPKPRENRPGPPVPQPAAPTPGN
ncbi:MAG TPA: c-type cytochrome [Edaphobacter sp.]|jgi:hypothetical protein|nr:c-type cytochrome [Edaphobacter sp.]